MEGIEDLTVDDLKDICRRRGISFRGKKKKDLQKLCFGKKPVPKPSIPREGDPPTEWGFETPTVWPDIKEEQEEEEEVEPSKLYSRYVQEEESDEPRKLKPFSAGEDVKKRKGVVRKRKKEDRPRVPGLPSGWQEGIYVPLIPPIGLTEEQQVRWQMEKQRDLIAWTQNPESWPPKGSCEAVELDLEKKQQEITALIASHKEELIKCRGAMKAREVNGSGREAARAEKGVAKKEVECETAKEKLRENIESLKKTVYLARAGKITESMQNQMEKLTRDIKKEEENVTKKEAQLQQKIVAFGKLQLAYEDEKIKHIRIKTYADELKNELEKLKVTKATVKQQIKEDVGVMKSMEMPPKDSPYYPRDRELIWMTRGLTPWISNKRKIGCAEQFCVWNIKNKDEYDKFIKNNEWLKMCESHAQKGKFCKRAKSVWIKPLSPSDWSPIPGKRMGHLVMEMLDSPWGGKWDIFDLTLAEFYRDLWTRYIPDFKTLYSKKLKNVYRVQL